MIDAGPVLLCMSSMRPQHLPLGSSLLLVLALSSLGHLHSGPRDELRLLLPLVVSVPTASSPQGPPKLTP